MNKISKNIGLGILSAAIGLGSVKGVWGNYNHDLDGDTYFHAETQAGYKLADRIKIVKP